VAQIGARRHYAVPRALHHAGLLESFATDACGDVAPWRWFDLYWPTPLRPAALQRVLARRIPDVPPARIRGLTGAILAALWSYRRREPATDAWARRNAAFCRRAVRMGFGRADTIYAFNGAALELFTAARTYGLRTVLDQTAAPWRWNAALLREERRCWPDWEVRPAEIDESGRLSEREEAEWTLSDQIVCGSQFAADALAESGGPASRRAVVPYPAPEPSFAASAEDRWARWRSQPLRVLFAGAMQLRKGIQYLWLAKQALGDEVTVRVIGSSALSEAVMRDLKRSMEILGARPRQEVAHHLAWADVLVLPTLSEGAANVCYEAMAAGVPVVTTPNAGSLVQHGSTGWLVQARDPDALVRALRLLAADPGLAARLAKTARAAMREQTLSRYAEALSEVVRNDA
jgi:glycosyltransferase involved in cell wall biosynthesis